jgi:hypothetical protein
MPAKSIKAQRAPTPTATIALDKATAAAVPDTRLSAAFRTALGVRPKQAHFPGQASVKAVEHAFKAGQPNGKGPVGPGLSAGFDARRGHK